MSTNMAFTLEELESTLKPRSQEEARIEEVQIELIREYLESLELPGSEQLLSHAASTLR